MGTIQQRFEVEQPVRSVYEAISQPEEILRGLHGVSGVTRIGADQYRINVGPADAPREVNIVLSPNSQLHRVEWRTADGTWSGAITAEPIGPARTAVRIDAEGAAGEGDAPQASVVHEALQALKRALQAQEVRISHADANYGARNPFSGARRYASEWRDAARSAFMRPTEYPFTLMRTITQQVDRFWGEMWRGTPIARLPHMVPGLSWNPNVEICEQNDHIRVCVDVPGVDESHIHVEVEEGYLSVHGERQDERGHEPGQRRSEFHYGSFTRRIPLPDGVDPESARAILRNGVLEIRIPRQRREPRRIPVQHAG
jgi:HSP20 family molecular chaperone IbpA/carbon monoxide dehydrogenase subunit G